MENIILCIVLVLGYAVLCAIYAWCGLRGRNAYLRYSVLGLIVVHGFLQVYFVYSKWKKILTMTDTLAYIQVGLLVLGVIALLISICVDRYVIKQNDKKDNKYCISYLNELRLIATEKGASNEIQDLLKYMTPKKCEVEDKKIENVLNNLSDENMSESYKVIKNLIKIREEKLKCR